MFWGWVWGGSGHYSAGNQKKCADVMLNWIKFTNNYHIVHFLTIISRQMTSQSDPDTDTD